MLTVFCLAGLVFGAFGGISSQFATLLRSLAKAGARRLYPRMASVSMKHCEATLLWQARRTLGHTLWTEGADLILHRMQHLGGPASRDRARPAIGPDNVMLSSSFSRRVTRLRPLMLIAWRPTGSIWVTTTAGSTGGRSCRLLLV